MTPKEIIARELKIAKAKALKLANMLQRAELPHDRRYYDQLLKLELRATELRVKLGGDSK